MRLIDADALTKRLNGYKIDCEQEKDKASAQVIDDCIAEIEDAQTVDITRRGEWGKIQMEAGTLAICSECKYPISYWHKTNFCPNCGAKMNRPAMKSQASDEKKIKEIKGSAGRNPGRI